MADIVIKLPDNFLKGMKIENGSLACQRILDAVYGGTMLPKGHGKIVDANRVLENGDNWEVETALMQTEAIIEADELESEDRECK